MMVNKVDLTGALIRPLGDDPYYNNQGLGRPQASPWWRDYAIQQTNNAPVDNTVSSGKLLGSMARQSWQDLTAWASPRKVNESKQEVEKPTGELAENPFDTEKSATTPSTETNPSTVAVASQPAVVETPPPPTVATIPPVTQPVITQQQTLSPVAPVAALPTPLPIQQSTLVQQPLTTMPQVSVLPTPTLQQSPVLTVGQQQPMMAMAMPTTNGLATTTPSPVMNPVAMAPTTPATIQAELTALQTENQVLKQQLQQLMMASQSAPQQQVQPT